MAKLLTRTQRRLLDGLEQISTEDKIFKAFWSKKKLNVASDGGLHNNRRMPPDVDLLTIISGCLKTLRRPFKAKWIKAHQDRVASYDSLPMAAHLI